MRIRYWSSDVCSSDLVITTDAPCHSGRYRRASGGLGQSRLRLRDDGTTRFRPVHRDVGQNLPVGFDARELEPVHALRIGPTLGATAGVEPLDLEREEAALLHLAVAIGVLPALLTPLPGDA